MAPDFIYQVALVDRTDKPACFRAAVAGKLCFAGDVMTYPGVVGINPELR